MYNRRSHISPGLVPLRQPYRAPAALAKPKPPQRQEREIFTHISPSYTALYKKLREDSRIEPIPGKVPDPLPASYDKDARCVYHSNFPGLDIEACRRLKQKIKAMFVAGEIVVR